MSPAAKKIPIGLAKVRKRYTIAAAARNLGLLMRKLFKMGKPRTQQPEGQAAGTGGLGSEEAFTSPESLLRQLLRRLRMPFAVGSRPIEAGECLTAA